ncbi:MAG: ABC transporter permease [Chloroflexi bacterium]|nr:ABC transporter permease [Chloroflexota bacterium]
MVTYILRRLVSTIPVLFGVSLLVFSFVHLIPGDPAVAMLGERASEENVARLREQMGLDDPLYVQYVRFLFGKTSLFRITDDMAYTTRRGDSCIELPEDTVCHTSGVHWTDAAEGLSCSLIGSRLFCHVGGVIWGDLGNSIHGNIPVAQELKKRFPATVELSMFAIVIATLIGIPLGVLSALRRNSLLDTLTMLGALIGVSMPIFWLAILLMWLFGLVLGWFPTGGRLGVSIELEHITNLYILDSILTGNWVAFKDALSHIILPSFALATIPLAIIARMTRSSMLEVLGLDYVRTARAKGLKESTVIIRHVMRNAMMPVVTIVGLQLGSLMGGAILTETVFSWPGIGKWVFDAISGRDYPIVQSVTLLIAVIFVAVNLLVDISYAVLNPRIRYK